MHTDIWTLYVYLTITSVIESMSQAGPKLFGQSLK